jgi:SnoaL-like domain
MHPIDAWHEFVHRRDPGLLDALLADDVVFHSPVVHTPQRGKAITLLYLRGAMQVLGSPAFRYEREIRGERDALLEFATEIDGITINGVDLIRWNDAGRIVDFKVMVRPLKAVNVLHQKMGELLAAMKPAPSAQTSA